MLRNFTELTPQEVISLAIAIERSNAEKYREWAMRIKSYSTAAARLFEEMATEERDHEQELLDRYAECFGGKPLPVTPETVDARLERPAVPGDHFFVYDDQFAQLIYDAALQSERGARDFYRSAIETTTDPRMLKVYTNLSSFEDEHVQILEETLVNLRRSGGSPVYSEPPRMARRA